MSKGLRSLKRARSRMKLAARWRRLATQRVIMTLLADSIASGAMKPIKRAWGRGRRGGDA